MSRCLSKDLINYQNAEEAKVLSIAENLNDADKELVRKLYEPLKITLDDLNREYSPADVKQLCLRTKVRVDMTLFNCVWDAKKRFDKKGRLTGRSERFINAMLVKAVKKEMVFPYTPEEIARCNHIRQCQLKMENNERLDRWQWKRKSSEGIDVVQSAEVIEECTDPDPSLLMAQIIPNEMPPPNSFKEPLAPRIIYPSSIATESVQESPLELPASEIDIWIDGDILEADGTFGEAVDEPAPESEPILAGNSSLNVKAVAIVADWYQEAIDLNTESITDETLDAVQESQPTQIDMPSQSSSSIAEDYNIFGTQVPCTSTQTPQSEPIQSEPPFML